MGFGGGSGVLHPSSRRGWATWKELGKAGDTFGFLPTLLHRPQQTQAGLLTFRLSVARSYSNTRIPGLLAPLTTPGKVVFHGVTPGVRNMTLMGAPFGRETVALRGTGKRRRGPGWRFPSMSGTCIIIKHPEAVSVVVPKELPREDMMVLPDHPQVLLVEALPEPSLVPRLLKEPWGHVANNVHLHGRGTQKGLEDALPDPSHLPPPKRPADRIRGPPPHQSRFRYSECPAKILPSVFHAVPLPVLSLPPGVPYSMFFCMYFERERV